jgi:hypothetical protein
MGFNGSQETAYLRAEKTLHKQLLSYLLLCIALTNSIHTHAHTHTHTHTHTYIHTHSHTHTHTHKLTYTHICKCTYINIFNSKIVSFAISHSKTMANIRPVLELKTRPRFYLVN